MVSMAQNRSLPEVLRSVVVGIAQCKNVVLARIWLIEQGDICATCRFRAECPDQTRCLHLVASAGNPGGAKADYTRLDGAFRRFPHQGVGNGEGDKVNSRSEKDYCKGLLEGPT